MCKPTNLAAAGPFRVDYSSCGSVLVHIGPTMMRLDPDCLQPLVETLTLASQRLPVVQRLAATPNQNNEHENN